MAISRFSTNPTRPIRTVIIPFHLSTPGFITIFQYPEFNLILDPSLQIIFISEILPVKFREFYIGTFITDIFITDISAPPYMKKNYASEKTKNLKSRNFHTREYCVYPPSAKIMAVSFCTKKREKYTKDIYSIQQQFITTFL